MLLEKVNAGVVLELLTREKSLDFLSINRTVKQRPHSENHRGHSHGHSDGHSRENAMPAVIFFIPIVITAVIFEGGLIACQSFVIVVIIFMTDHLNALAVAAVLQYLVTKTSNS